MTDLDARPVWQACPGWEGNGFACPGSRWISLSAQLCENCARGKRKRAQRDRELEEERKQLELEEAERFDRYAERLREATKPGGNLMAVLVACIDEELDVLGIVR